MSSWNWAPLLWNHPDRDEGGPTVPVSQARISASFKGCCFHLQGRKAGLRKEGKQLFIHLHLFMPLLHSMKGLGGTDKGSWGKWGELSLGVRLGHTGIYGSATDNVTNVSFSRPPGSTSSFSGSKCYNGNVLDCPAETPEVAPGRADRLVLRSFCDKVPSKANVSQSCRKGKVCEGDRSLQY